METMYERRKTFFLNGKDEQCQLNTSLCVAVYLYYEDTLPRYYEYMDRVIAGGIEVLFISSKQSVLDKLQARYVDAKSCKYILKPNQGRDISALLIEAAKEIVHYKYFCFLHDKKEKKFEQKADVDLWISNLWGNLLGSTEIINQIVSIFEKNKAIGVLSAPDPIGDNFIDWYGGGWEGSFLPTKELAHRLNMGIVPCEEEPPLSLGTAFWARVDAVKKIFGYPWDYSDFDDCKLSDPSYVSYGVERIMPYVAMDAGYEAGEVLTIEYALLERNYLRTRLPMLKQEILGNARLLSYAQVVNVNKALDYISDGKTELSGCYIYGVKESAKYLLYQMRRRHIAVKGFVESEKSVDEVEGLPVYSLKMFEGIYKGELIVLGASSEKSRTDIKALLGKQGFENYLDVWDDR